MRILKRAMAVGCCMMGLADAAFAQAACTTTLEMTSLPSGAFRPERLRFSRGPLPQLFTVLEGAELVLTGGEIKLVASLREIDVGVALEPFELPLPSGLPDGNYRVRTQMTRNGAPCPTQVFPLQIGASVTAIPANQPWGMIGLCVGLVLLSVGSLRWSR